MLNIEEVKSVSFRRAGFGGYKPEDVDNFIDKIQVSYEEMMRERQNLILRIQKLEASIKKFHDEENSIRDVLLNLKGITEKSLSEAEIKAKGIISQAEQTSAQMISSAKEKVSIQEEISKNLKKESIRLKACLEEIYKEHMEIIKKIPSIESSELVDKKESCEVQSKAPQKPENPQEIGNIVGGMVQSVELESASKLQDLQFGSDYKIGKPHAARSGLYGGIFKGNV